MADPDREARARTFIRRVVDKKGRLFAKDFNQRTYREHLEREEIETVVAVARSGDADAVEILREYARGALRAGMAIPEDLLRFGLECFIDGPPKAKPGSRRKDTAIRDQTIGILVMLVAEEYGFPQYTAAEHRDDPSARASACRLVAEELGLSERTVEKILADRKASITRSRIIRGKNFGV